MPNFSIGDGDGPRAFTRKRATLRAVLVGELRLHGIKIMADEAIKVTIWVRAGTGTQLARKRRPTVSFVGLWWPQVALLVRHFAYRFLR